MLAAAAAPSKKSSKTTTSGDKVKAKELTIYPSYCHDASSTLPRWCPLRCRDVHALRDVGMYVPELTRSDVIEAPGSHKSYRMHHYGNHPIKFVKVVGVVVAVDEFVGRRVYTIDDSSGACLECTCVVPVLTSVDMLGGNPASEQTGGVTYGNSTTTTSMAQHGGGGVLTRHATVQQAASREPGVDHPNVPWGLIDVGTVIKVKGRVGSFRDTLQVEVVNAFLVKGTEFEVKFWDEARVFKDEVLGQDWVVGEEMMQTLKKKAERRKQKAFREGRKGLSKSEKTTNHGDGEGIGSGGDGLDRRERDAARRLLEKQMRARARKEEAKRKKMEEEEEQRRDAARVEEEKRKRRRELEEARNRIRYPSPAVRKAVAGKYDLLGI